MDKLDILQNRTHALLRLWDNIFLQIFLSLMIDLKFWLCQLLIRAERAAVHRDKFAALSRWNLVNSSCYWNCVAQFAPDSITNPFHPTPPRISNLLVSARSLSYRPTFASLTPQVSQLCHFCVLAGSNFTSQPLPESTRFFTVAQGCLALHCDFWLFAAKKADGRPRR